MNWVADVKPNELPDVRFNGSLDVEPEGPMGWEFVVLLADKYSRVIDVKLLELFNGKVLDSMVDDVVVESLFNVTWLEVGEPGSLLVGEQVGLMVGETEELQIVELARPLVGGLVGLVDGNMV